MSQHEFRRYATHHHGISSTTLNAYEQHIHGMTRAVIEERPTHFREIDVFSRLIMDRIIFLGAQVEENIANIIVAQLLFLESVDPKKDVLLYVNSPGGVVHHGLSIYDTMQYIKPDVATICTGMAASMGAVLLAGGAAGKRAALPHARVMIHQPLGGAQGQASDMEITIKEMMKVKQDLVAILANHSGKGAAQVEQDMDRDYWLRAEEAKNYGLIDEVLTKSK